MSSLQYTSELVAEALEIAGELTSTQSSWYTRVLGFFNRLYRGLATGGMELNPAIKENWLWLKKSGSFVLEPYIETGTVNVTSGSTALIFSSAPTKDVTGWFLKVEGHPDVFKIQTHTASSVNATLDVAYTGDTNTLASYEIYKLDYTLPSDTIRLFTPMQAFQRNTYEIHGIGLEEYNRSFSVVNLTSGVPDRFTQIDETTVRFNKKGLTSSVRVNYNYIYLPSDLLNTTNEEPVVPLRYRNIFSEFAGAMILFEKNDQRAEIHLGIARAILQSMANDNRKLFDSSNNMYGRILQRGTNSRKILRTDSGLIIGYV